MHEMLVAIRGSGGILSAVAQRVGCVRQTVARYMQRYPSVREAIEQEREMMIDAVEAVAYRQAREGDGPMIRFLLATVGKTRGYTERHEVVGSDNGPLRVQVEYVNDWRTYDQDASRPESGPADPADG